MKKLTMILLVCIITVGYSVKKMGKNPEFCSEILSEITEFFKSQNLYMEL